MLVASATNVVVGMAVTEGESMTDLTPYLSAVRKRLAKADKGKLGTKADYHRCHCASYRCSCDPLLESYFTDLPRLLALAEAAEEVVEALKDLVWIDGHEQRGSAPVCNQCGQNWPCAVKSGYDALHRYHAAVQEA